MKYFPILPFNAGHMKFGISSKAFTLPGVPTTHAIQTTLMAIAVTGVALGDVTLESKSGISMTLAGTKGADFEVEELYHDPLVLPRRIIYVKDGTKISFAHNSRNVMGSNALLSAADRSKGIIRYKVDQERSRKRYVGGDNPAYSRPICFAEMRYADGSNVVGSTGDNGQPREDQTKYWTKGTLGQGGDEYHTLLIWDDDSWRTSNLEYKASDGVYHLFVVNPKTPCLTWSKSGNGQFYTTPAKNYWIPVIFDQTTYFQGEVSCTLRDINGNHVFYRINGGAFVNAGASSVTLTAGDFNQGNNTLEYYYAGQSSHTKMRKVVKNPTFPSAVENHGNLMWVNETGWQEVASRLGSDPYAKIAGRLEWDELRHGQANWRFRNLRRNDRNKAIVNAFVAKRRGNNYSNFDRNGEGSTTPYAQFAKEMILDNTRTMDAVGYESSWPGEAIPNKEQFYRGYWDVDAIYSIAFSYDILISQYRSDQHPKGITPIEDYFIRDCLASWAWECLQVRSGMVYLKAERGMWGNARSIGGIVAGMVMPKYNTPYYGTSGFDNSTTATHLWCPFPNQAYTWKQVLFDPDSETTRPGYPNLDYRRFLEALNDPNKGLFRGTGDWADKIGYLDYGLCGHSWMILANLSKQYYPEREWPLMFLGFEKATKGTLKALNTSPTKSFRRAMILLMNANYPNYAANNLSWIRSRAASDKESEAKQLSEAGVFGMVWYDHDYNGEGGGGPPVDPPSKTADPTFTPTGGVYSAPQAVALGTLTPEAEIYYTLDGTAPTATEGVLFVPGRLINLPTGTTLIRAVALREGYLDSTEVSAEYTVGNIVANPVFTPLPGRYLTAQTISISSLTPLASIYYTTDGSSPTTQSNVFNPSTSLLIDSTTMVRAIAVREGFQTSEIISADYQIGGIVSDNKRWDNIQLSAPQSDEFIFRVQVTPSNSSVNSVIGLSSEVADTWSDLAAIVLFSPQGVVEARNGGTYEKYEPVQPSSPYNYSAGVTYTVIFSINPVTKRYSATVHAPGETPVQIAHNFAFRTEQSAASQLSYLSIWTEKGPTVLEVVLTPPRGLKVLTPGN